MNLVGSVVPCYRGRHPHSFSHLRSGALACVPGQQPGQGLFLLPAVVIVDVVLTVIAGLKAADGEHYRYPFAIRLIK